MKKEILQEVFTDMRETVLADKTKPLKDKKEAYLSLRDGMLNPKAVFDPETFDPYDDVENYEAMKRPRVVPPRRLPTLGLKPKEIMEGQMVGMFESKQDLYLMIAWLSERVSDLEDLVDSLKKKNIEK